MANDINFWATLRKYLVSVFSSKKKQVEKRDLNRPLSEEDIHLEPKYWQEVIEFIDNLNNLIKTHTIEDSNVEQINRRIVDYVQEQINIKGSIENIEERYSALDTLADRILTNSISKIVGLKRSETTNAEFTQVVETLKKRLHERRQFELTQKNQPM